MEIHIQLAGVELGPYSEKQVRDYLAEGLLSASDPARFEGTETWEAVSEVLAKMNKPAVTAPAPPEKAPQEPVLPQEAMISSPLPVPPTAVRKSSLITSTTPLPRTNRDTIRVPLPQLAKALAKQTTQPPRVAASAEPAPLPPAVAETPPRPASTNSVPLPAKPSDMARTSLLSAVKILGKKSTQELKSIPVERGPEGPKTASPSLIPVDFSKTPESLRTMPIPMGKSLVKKVEPAERTMPPMPPAPSTKSPELPSNAPKALDKKQTALLATVDALAKKADADSKPMTSVRALSATRSPEISAAPSKAGETRQIHPPSPIKVLPKAAPVESAPPTETPSLRSTTSIPAPKSPQTLRTAPMSMVRALPKKGDAEAKTGPVPSPAVSDSTLKEVLPPPVETVRFVPAESDLEAGNATKSPPVAPESVLTKKTLRRTTGSLPSLVQTLAKKPDEPATAKTEEAPKPEAVPELPVEAVVEEEAKPQSSPFVSWFKSLAGKFGGSKQAEPDESTVVEPPPEVVEAKDPAPKTPDQEAPVEKAPEPTPKTIKLVRKTDALGPKLDPVEKAPEPKAPESKKAKSEPKPPEIIQTALGPLSPRLPPAQKPLGSIRESVEPARKTPNDLADTVKLIKPPLRTLPKKIELNKDTPKPGSEKPVSIEKTPEPETQVKAAEEPSPEVEEAPAVTRSKLRPGVVIGVLVVLVVVAGLALGAYYYVGQSHRAADSLLQALKDGNQAQLTKSIDFPSVRKALTDETMGQVSKAEGQGSATDALVSAMIKNSIDYYVTPEALSALATKPDKLPKPGQGPTLLPQRAVAILNALNSLPVKSQGLVSPTLYVIDLDAAKLDLQFAGTGWKLERVELKTNFQLPQEPGAPAAPVDMGASMVVPVIETYLTDGKTKFQAGDLDGAIDAFNQVLVLDPKLTVAYNNRAIAKKEKGDLKGAIADFTQALTLDPRLAEAYFNRGEAKAAQNDTDGALADYTQATNLNPNMGMAFYKRGGIRTLKGDYEGALADYTQDIAVDPNYANAYNNRGYVRRAQNDLDGAIADFTQALAINPKIAEAYFNRALAKRAKVDLDGAILDFNKALDLDPKMARAYYNRGVAKNTKNDLDGALADYNQALILDPRLALALSDRGVVKLAKGDQKGALADFNQALEIDQKIDDAYYFRGLIKEQLNDLDGAIADSSRAIDLDPRRTQAYYNRGFAKLVKGNLEGAHADLQKFCELSPRDAFADSARLYLWLIGMAQNPNGTANQDLSDALQNSWTLTSDDLITKIAGYLLDRKTEADLVAAAVSPNAKKDAGQHCEIWYFIGMKKLLAGDKVAAIDYFRKCLATGQKDYCEYILAQAELQVLAPNP